MNDWRIALGAQKSVASMAFFRFAVGAILFASTLRFLVNGWVDRFFAEPTYFFPYWGMSWLPVASPETLFVIHALMATAALCVAVGLFYRVMAPALFLTFTYVELIDVTNYLNHYYLVSLLLLLMAFMPLSGAYSLDAWRRPVARRDTVPAWMLYVLRLQIGVVYFYAAMAKVEPDWLLHAQPLGIWLAARAEVPLLGPLLALPAMPFVMSWAGFLNDLLAVPLLLNRKTRPWGFAMILVFHTGTHLLFTIGIFPFLMPLCATLFFDPDWPLRLAKRLGVIRDAAPSRRRAVKALPRLGLLALAVYAAIQVLVPLRTHLYDGSVLWHEQGMRWSWRVMLREKNGSVTYRVNAAGWAHEREVHPRRYLTSHQEREMSGQPDMILRLAHHIRDELRADGERDVEVRVDALVSLNGRPAAPMIDPDADLARVEDGLGDAAWITPMPDSDPLPAIRRSTYAAQ